MTQIICSCGRIVHTQKNKLAVCKCGRKYSMKTTEPKRSFKKKGATFAHSMQVVLQGAGLLFFLLVAVWILTSIR